MVNKGSSIQTDLLDRFGTPQLPLWVADDGPPPVPVLPEARPVVSRGTTNSIPEVHCLGLWQPWASLMALRLKKIETRSFSTGSRGWIAIQATKTWNADLAATCRLEPFRTHLREAGYTDASLLPRGVVVALGRLVDVQRTERLHPEPTEHAYGDYSRGRWGWIFDEVIPLAQPEPLRAQRGLFPLPSEDAARIWSAAHSLHQAAPATHTERHTLYTFGYHGQKLATLLGHQERLGAMIVDVRWKAEVGAEWHRWNLHRELTKGEGNDRTPFYYWCRALGNPQYREGTLSLANPEVGFALLEDILQHRPVLVLCACEDWQSCHRRLVAEGMAARGYRVEHLGATLRKTVAEQAALL
jgi:hypothetical protein